MSSQEIPTNHRPGRIDWGVKRSIAALLRAVLAANIAATVTGVAWLVVSGITSLWNGAQIVLVLHLLSGLVVLGLLLAFVPAHQSCVDPLSWLFAPFRAWRRKGADDDPTQRRRGYLLVWIALLTLGSGLWVFYPIAGWGLGQAWAPEAVTYDAMRWVHRLATIALLIVAVGHMVRKT